jgi:hypothetical protein
MAIAGFSELFVVGVLRQKLQYNERIKQQAEVGLSC